MLLGGVPRKISVWVKRIKKSRFCDLLFLFCTLTADGKPLANRVCPPIIKGQKPTGNVLRFATDVGLVK